MLRIHARVSTMLLTLAALLIFAACQPSDPWEQLALARQDYRVETRNWIPTDPQPIEPAADADGDAEADGTADAESDVPTKFTSAIINFTVYSGGAMDIGCVTTEVVFQDASGNVVTRETQEIDVSGIQEVGGSLDRSLTLALPDGVEAMGIDLVPAGLEDLRTMCEAKAVDAGGA